MKLAIASGKGGTGKTTLSVALALAADRPVSLLDCDVEEPNGHIFLRPQIEKRERVVVPVPVIDDEACTGCVQCSSFCQFNALVCLGSKTLVFPELCHSCGGCTKVCPTGAISEEDREIGSVECGHADGVDFIQGCLDVGHAMSPPVIRAVKHHIDPDTLTILDCPPGTSCPMITAVRDADVAVLVTEPTPFGLHDLKLAVETMRDLGLPFGVVVNRSDAGDDLVRRYCETEAIPILLEIPEDRRVAEAYSRGQSLLDAAPDLRPRLRDVLTAASQLQRGNQPS